MSCKHCAHCEEQETRQRPRFARASSAKEGGCNFCTRHTTARGEGAHSVTTIASPSPCGLRARICDDCLNDLFAFKPGVPR